MNPAIGFAPWNVRPGPTLSALPLSELSFPLGLPDRLLGKTLGDLGPEDHVIFYPKSGFYRGRFGLKAQISIVIAEPRAVHGWHMALLPYFHRRFFRVLTRDRRLLARIPNGVFYNHTFTYVDDPETVDTTKSKLCSLIASGKRDQVGHRLRHRLVAEIRTQGLNVDVMGQGYAPFEAKADGLAPYCYSVVIENSRELVYISEKLVDAALCRTIPIYWGAPDVSDWFDTRGMIICESEAEILETLRSLPERDPDDFAVAVEANRVRGLELMEGDRLAVTALAHEIGLDVT
ncbi:MAG: glycosyltransferase family 10 [Pseudomonadota bacterium]